MKKLLALAPIAALVIAGCGGDGTGITNNTNPRIRVVNALPGVDAVDVRVSGTTVLDDATFGTVSAYKITDNGNRNVVFLDATSGGEIINNESLYEENEWYTVVGAGSAGNRTFIRFEDVREEPVAGRTKLRVANADASVGPIDVFVTPVGEDDLTGVTPTSDDLAFGDVTPSFVERDAGSYRIRIYNADRSQLLADETVSIQSRQIRTVLVVDSGADSDLIVLNDRN